MKREMNRTLKLLLGIATLWPGVYVCLFFFFIFSTFLFLGGGGDGAGFSVAFATIFVLHLFTMLIITALTVYYIVNVFRNDRVEKDKKALWAVVLFMGNIIAMPIYWYIYIWKAAPELPVSAPGHLGSANTSAWTNDVRAHKSEQEPQYVPPPTLPNWRE